jgi:hypothetical protein
LYKKTILHKYFNITLGFSLDTSVYIDTYNADKGIFISKSTINQRNVHPYISGYEENGEPIYNYKGVCT